MKKSAFFFMMMLCTYCTAQETVSGVHRENNKYRVDTAVVLENKNLDQLLNALEKEKMAVHKSL